MFPRLARTSNAVFARPFALRQIVRHGSSELGSGAGKGGGDGGYIRQAGGSLGRFAVAHEESYFRKLQCEQMRKNAKKHVDEEIVRNEAEIRRLQQYIKFLKAKRTELNRPIHYEWSVNTI